MRPYFDPKQIACDCPREQPWSVSDHDPEGRYYNFVLEPGLVPTVLEDFRPFDNYDGIRTFYKFVQWMNGSESIFETSDCRFRGPQTNLTRDLADKELQCIVELVHFFRSPEANLSEMSDARFSGSRIPYDPGKLTKRMLEVLHQDIEREMGTYPCACTALMLLCTYFTEANVPLSQKLGHSVITRTWIWGDTEQELFGNMQVAVNMLWIALRNTSASLSHLVENRI